MRTTLTVFTILAAILAAILTATAPHAAEWTYDGTSRLTHAATGWILTVTADGTDLTVTGYAKIPRSPASLPLADAISGGTHRITAIGDHTLSGGPHMKALTLPATVTRIGSNALRSNGNLTSITVAAGNPAYRSDGGVLFSKDGTLIHFPIHRKETAYAIPPGTVRIGTAAFIGSFLTHVTIPDSVTEIGNQAFQYCSRLTNPAIPASVTSISSNAFSDCTAITAITVAEDNPAYRSIDGVVFSKDGRRLIAYPTSKHGAYTIPHGVTHIDDTAFQSSRNLPDIAIPASLTDFDHSAFQGCSELTNITVAADNPAYRSIGGALFNKNGSILLHCPWGKTGAYAIPHGTTHIDNSAFYGCQHLTSVTIPGSVTGIGHYAFGSCHGLTEITIPASVAQISGQAFMHCRGLRRATFEGECPTVTGWEDYGMFRDSANNATVFIRAAHTASWAAKVTGSMTNGRTAEWQGSPVRVLPPVDE